MRLIIILTCLALAACGDDRAPSGTPDVTAAFYPLAYAAREIAPPGARVTDLTPAGAEPHDIEPAPKDIQRLRESDHAFLLGHGFQPALEEAAEGQEGAVALLETPGLELREGDPHVWLDPMRFAHVARRIGRELEQPGRAERFAARLAALDRRYREGLARCERRELVTSHDAFAYLARRYGLRTIPVSGLDPEAEPTPGSLATVIARVRAHRATTVFTEPLASRRIADAIARATGARVGELNPIETLTEHERDRGENYFSVMEDNLAALREGLGCR